MSACILFIDGENFLHKVKDILREKKIDEKKIDLALIDLDKLFGEALKGFKISRKIFYAAHLHIYPDTKRKSEELIKLQRKLRNRLIKQGSDSDLQPAVKELKERKVEIVYLGFEASPNKGLTYTTNKTILLRNSEVAAALPRVTK